MLGEAARGGGLVRRTSMALRECGTKKHTQVLVHVSIYKGSILVTEFLIHGYYHLGPPVAPFYRFFFGWEGSPTKIDYRKMLVPLF